MSIVIGITLLICPECGHEIPQVSVKEWNFRRGYYRVKKYSCPNCKKSVFEYYHDGKFCFTIPRFAGLKLSVMKYLRKNGSVTAEEIAEKLNLKVEDVLNALSELEKDGVLSAT